jgi:hypothetical protein
MGCTERRTVLWGARTFSEVVAGVEVVGEVEVAHGVGRGVSILPRDRVGERRMLLDRFRSHRRRLVAVGFRPAKCTLLVPWNAETA